MEAKLNTEVLDFISSRKTLQLASIQEDGSPYSSYAPFAIGEECLYVLLSEIAIHGVNLQHNPKASVLIVQDEDAAEQIFARVRVNYSVEAELIPNDTEAWELGVKTLAERQGQMIEHLSQMQDFKLFKLNPKGGRYVKGFGKAYTLAGETLAGEEVNHLRDGHKKREEAKA